jgi:hypothetical protein
MMKTMKTTRTFTLKKVALAMMIAAGSLTSAYAVMTGNTGPIIGQAPVLSSPGKNTAHSVDFASSTPDGMLTGSTVTMTYKYKDEDGDLDDSIRTVQWYYVPNGGGVPVAIPSSGTEATAADGTTLGADAITIPDTALGATLKVVVTETSISGAPTQGRTITYDNIALNGKSVDPENPGIEEPTDGTPAPVGPDPSKPGIVEPGSEVKPGIYLSTDATYTTNLIGVPATKLKVGESYVFKLFGADGTTDLTSTVNYNWRLTGTSATTGKAAPAAGGIVTPISNVNFDVPVNSVAKDYTGTDDGAQGFSLAVDYNAK